MKLRTPFILGAAAVALVAGAALPANADTGDTTATFTLVGGTLNLTVEANAPLDNSVSGDTSITGSLGVVDVSDTRGTTAGWSVSAASSAFVDGAGSSSTSVSYNSGTVTKTGTVTAASVGAAVVIDADAPVVTGTAASGNNTASFAPSLAITLPASALAGAYTGTVTTSVA